MAARDSNGAGKPGRRVDPEQAFLFYASLPAEGRSYRKVAEHYRVSVRTVEGWGLRGGWKERARLIDADAAAQASSALVDEKAAQYREIVQLIKASYVTYAQGLRRGDVRVTPADLPRLHKLMHELWDDQAAEQPSTSTDPAPSTWPASAERKLEVLRVLHEAGALRRLQELVERATDENPAETGEEGAAS